MVSQYGREKLCPPHQAGDSTQEEGRIKPEGRKDAGEQSLRKHGTPAGKGVPGSQWASGDVAVGSSRREAPPKSYGGTFAIGYAARRNETELKKGGQSIVVSSTTGWAARPGPATETETTSSAARPGPAAEKTTRSPNDNQEPRVKNHVHVHRCAHSVGAHDREQMRAAPGVDAAMLNANEANVFIAVSKFELQKHRESLEEQHRRQYQALLGVGEREFPIKQRQTEEKGINGINVDGDKAQAPRVCNSPRPPRGGTAQAAHGDSLSEQSRRQDQAKLGVDERQCFFFS